MFATMLSILPQVRSGKLRALGVTGSRRSAAAPQLLTISESGAAGYEANAWFATFVAAGMPAARVHRLNSAIVQVVASAELRQRLATQGAEASTSTPQALGRYAQDEMVRWQRVIRESGARAD